MRQTGLALLVAVATSIASCGGRGGERGSAPGPAGEDYAARIQAWRDKHEADYRHEYASIAGLHFLEPGTHTVGSDASNDIVLRAHVPARIGRITVAEGAVRFEPEPDLRATQGGRPIPDSAVLKEPGTPPAHEVIIGDVRLVVHLSGERLSLRVRDPNGEPATSFRGFAWFPIDPAYRVTGRFLRDPGPQKVTVLNTFNDVTEYTTEGVVEFVVHGQTVRLRPFTTRPGRLYFVFRDASSGQETYKTARFLYADLLPDGTTVLDFNEAYNPPCAFNPYTTCPIPLRENGLPVKILAGERAYAGEAQVGETETRGTGGRNGKQEKGEKGEQENERIREEEEGRTQQFSLTGSDGRRSTTGLLHDNGPNESLLPASGLCFSLLLVFASPLLLFFPSPFSCFPFSLLLFSLLPSPVFPFSPSPVR